MLPYFAWLVLYQVVLEIGMTFDLERDLPAYAEHVITKFDV